MDETQGCDSKAYNAFRVFRGTLCVVLGALIITLLVKAGILIIGWLWKT